MTAKKKVTIGMRFKKFEENPAVVSRSPYKYRAIANVILDQI